MIQKVWVMCVEAHTFHPGKEIIKLNKDTTIEINTKYKEHIYKRVWGVYSLNNPESIKSAVEDARRYYLADGYLVDIDKIDKMNPDKPKDYIEFSGGSHDLIISDEVD